MLLSVFPSSELSDEIEARSVPRGGGGGQIGKEINGTECHELVAVACNSLCEEQEPFKRVDLGKVLPAHSAFTTSEDHLLIPLQYV